MPHQRHANQIHGYTHHLVLFALLGSLFFLVLLYALHVICVFVLRSLIVTLICKITVFIFWLTHTNQEILRHQQVNPECASSTSCKWQFVYDAIISNETRTAINAAIGVIYQQNNEREINIYIYIYIYIYI